MFFVRNILPKTLLARFMLIIIVPTLISQILVIFLFYDRHWYNVSYYTSNLIVNEINSLFNKISTRELYVSGTKEDYLNVAYQFHSGAKLPKVQPRLPEELEIFHNILNSKITLKKIIKLNTEHKIEVLFAFKGGVLKIFFAAKLLMNPTTYIFISWLIFLTITLLSISLIFCKQQIKSILQLTTVADNFGRGLKTTLVYKPSGAREIRRAGIAFLRMKRRIEKQILQRTQMLAMISHDLCTPLTRMKLQLELLDATDEITALKSDVLSMQQMINSYLDFARGEGGEEFTQASFKEWLTKLITTQWPKLNYSLKAPTTTVNVQIKPHAFARAITNIINNAVKYATRVKITLHTKSQHAIITIEDNGPGILDKEKSLVFKPFYRSDKSRSLDNSSNIGLGLAIAEEIIKRHYGNIVLKDSKELGGLLVKISLPLADNRQL